MNKLINLLLFRADICY